MTIGYQKEEYVTSFLIGYSPPHDYHGMPRWLISSTRKDKIFEEAIKTFSISRML
jgi:hypothetical protein